MISLCIVQENTAHVSWRSGWPEASTWPMSPERAQCERDQVSVTPKWRTVFHHLGNRKVSFLKHYPYPEASPQTPFPLCWKLGCVYEDDLSVCLQQKSLSKPGMALHRIKAIPPVGGGGQGKQPSAKQTELEWGQGQELQGHLSWHCSLTVLHSRAFFELSLLILKCKTEALLWGYSPGHSCLFVCFYFCIISVQSIRFH